MTAGPGVKAEGPGAGPGGPKVPSSQRSPSRAPGETAQDSGFGEDTTAGAVRPHEPPTGEAGPAKTDSAPATPHDEHGVSAEKAGSATEHGTPAELSRGDAGSPRADSAEPKTAVGDGPAAPPPARSEPPNDRPATGHDDTRAEAGAEAKAPSDRALDKMVERATGKVEAQEAKAAAARAARAKANRSAHEVRRDQRQEQFDKEQLEQNLPVRKLTPHEHADRALQEAHAKEKVNGAGKGKPETVAPKKSALTPEQEVKARVRRQERFEQEQRAAGADDQDLRQLTEEQHKKLGELERQMDAARARENSARQTVEKAGTPTPKSEPVTSESVRSGADEGPGHSDADSSATPAERALNTMVERAAGKVKAQEARAAEWEGKAAEVKKAAAEAAFRATPRGRRQEQFDKERAEQGLKPRKLTPQEHADRVVQEAHAREDANAAGKGKPAAAASKKSARAAEQEKAKAARQDRFEQEQRAAGAGEQDVRELTEAEHKKLGELEQRMNAARAKEKAALQKLEKAGKPEPPTGEPARSGADEGPGQTHADSSATPAERALGKMVERATAKVEAREAKADAAAKAGRSAHEIRRDQRQERFDKERADGGLEPRKLTPQEHAERALQEAYAREKTNVAGSGESKAPSAEKTAHAAEQEKKTQAWRQERFEREQRAAGVGEEDLRQLTPEEHKKLGELEQRMNAARAKEKTALQKLEKAGKPAPEAEPATGEPARGADQTHGEPTPDAEPSAKAPSDRALGKMVERATAKVEAREAKADAAAKAGRSAHEIRRDQRQERFDKERADGGLEPRKLTPQEHAERVVQEAHAREDGNGRSTAAASEKSARAAEQEAKAKAWRQERYEQRQKAAGAADDDLRQLTTEEHTELAGLEQRMDIARAREKVAQAKLEKMQKAGSANGEERPATDTGNGAAPSEAKNAAEPSDDGLVRNGTSDDAVSSDAPADAESATKTPAERALDDMRQRATAKVEAQEAKAAAAAKASRSAHEIRRDQRQERFDKERADGGLEPRKLTPQEHADRIVQETHAREDANAAGKGKPEATSAEKAAHAAEQEAKAKAWRQERFEQEQRAAGAGEEDLRQLTPEEHKKLGELERRMDAARAEEKTARQKLQKAGKAEPATGEPARAEERPQGETTTGADSSATPAERALDKMVERATAKVKAQETKASAATKAARSAHEIRRDQRQERFDKEQVDGGLEPRKLTPQEHAERVVQEAHAREDRNGKSTASRQQKPGQEQWAEGAEATDVTSPAGVRRPGPQDHNAETRQRADKFEELLRHKRENATSTGTASESSAAGPAAGRAAPANPTRQLFRTDLKTREMHLVEVVRGDRLGKAGPAEEDRADADADAGGAKASGQYEYREIAPGTRTAVETRLGPNEVVVSAKPARGQEHGAFAYKKGQRIPIGDPAERLAVFDHAAGTWDVATVNHKPGGATSEQSHQVSGPRAGEPALPKEDVKPVQILRRDGDGNIDLLTYERPPENVRLPGGGKSDGFKYHGLAKDDPKGWHNRTPLGTPKVERLVTAPKANRLSGKPIADRTSSAIVRDPKTGLYEKLTEVSSGAKAGPTGPGKSYYRIKDDGTLERVTFKVERLDVVKVRADGTVAHTKWAASGKGNAAPVLDKDGSLTSSSSRKPSIDELRYDKVSGQIIRAEDTHARGPDGGGGSGDGPGGGKGFGTRSKSAGGQTENVVETYTEERPATDTATAAKPAEKGEDRPAANKDKLPGKGRFPGKGKPPGESPARPDNKARADGFKKLIGRSGPGPGSGSGDGAGSGGGGGSQRVRAGDGSSTTTEHPDAPATGGPAEEHTGGPGAATDRPDAGPGGTDRPAADHDAATRPYDAAHGEPKVGGEGPVKTPSDREPPADHDAATRPYDAAHGEPKVGGEASAKTPSDPEPPATGERPTVKPEAQRTKTDAAPDSAATDDRPAQEVPREQRQEKLDKEPDERGLPQRTSTPKEHPDRTGQEPPTRDRANAGGTGEPKAAAPRKPEAAAPKKPEAAAPRKPTRTPDQLRQAAIHRQERFTQEQRAEGVREEDLRELTPEEHAKLADLEERMDAARAEEKAALQAVPKTEAAGTRTASAAEAVGGDTPKTADAVSVEVSPSADEKAVPQEVPKADAVGSRVEPVAEAGGGDTLKTADAAGTRTEAAVDAVGGDTSKTGGAAGAETSPSADGVAAPAREPLGRQVLDDAAQTLTLVGRVDDAVARQLRADGRILARHFAGLPGAARLSPAESAHVDEVFGAELAWAGFEGASRFGERLFGVDGGLLPSSAVLDGVRERATLDPRRADAVLSLRLGSDRYRDAALQLLNQLHDDSAAVSPDAIRVVAARIAQNSISDVVAEAGRPLAADLLDGTSQTLPYEPRDHEPRDHEAATPPVRGESETAVHQALTTVWPLSADASAQIWAEAGAIVRETAEPAQVSGLKAYLQEDFKPRLLVAAELTGGGPDAARALARAFATGGESAGRVVGGPVSDQATMLLLQGVVWRIQTALQALGEEPDLLASLAGQADDVLEQLGLPPGHVLAAAGFLVGGETVDGRSPSQAVDDLVQALTGETEIGKTDEAVPDAADLDAPRKTPGEQPGLAHLETHHPQAGKRPAERGRGPARKGKPRPAEPAGDDAASVRRRHDGGQAGRPTEDTVHAADRTEAAPDGVEPVRPDPTDLRAARRLLNEQPRAQSERAKREARKIVQGLGGRAATTAPGSADPDADHLRVGLLVAAWIVRTGGEGADEFARSLMPDRSAAPGAPGVPADGLDWQGSSHSAGPYCVQAALVHRGS
ncbi:hypothetical protein [Actinomadura sp. DC4]|uniref:hypothetical protein n=1 Tax=Actinomadura sp. DC4 TaxID=3055069 RepID=UPI0025AF2306|nr:hypothetical protein [Actinomadura sp. DC4]MDN3357279.1 hypothetical protein [Actinomadura sp. DC4]